MKVTKTVTPKLAEAKSDGVVTEPELQESFAAAREAISKATNPVELTQQFTAEYEGLKSDTSVTMDKKAENAARGAFWELQHTAVERASELALAVLEKRLPSADLSGPLAQLDVSSLRLRRVDDETSFPHISLLTKGGERVGDENPIVKALRALISDRPELGMAQIGYSEG